MPPFTARAPISMLVPAALCVSMCGCGLLPKSDAKLEKMLHSDDPYACQKAILTLAQRQRVRFVGEFIQLLRTDHRAMVRAAAATALGNMRSAEAVPALVEAVTDTRMQSAVRWDAALALGKIGSHDAVKGLTQAAHYATDPYVRAAAVSSLGKIGNAAAIDALIAALRDQDPNVVHAAARALQEATGEPFNMQYDHWVNHRHKAKAPAVPIEGAIP